MNPEQGGEGSKRMSESIFRDVLISRAQIKLAEELSELAQNKDKKRDDTLFFDYVELRNYEFTVRIMANRYSEDIKKLNEEISKLDRLDLDTIHTLRKKIERMEEELADFDDTLSSLADGIENIESENTTNKEFLEFKKLIEEKEGQMLEQVSGPEDVSLN